ncbi:hypothetical protein B0H67DRAFT_138622 [Lasiosphaeris hirsuta]|uniref:Uncharacterized protein n=1 Tax=Lasiosphaeris hirsuta TaxID=260670 RepID=A0AA40B172_9PEZI|nr:hypothetical protein B0H67DRAFT_138622 [Lasiosphaeris hirsuta]
MGLISPFRNRKNQLPNPKKAKNKALKLFGNVIGSDPIKYPQPKILTPEPPQPGGRGEAVPRALHPVLQNQPAAPLPPAGAPVGRPPRIFRGPFATWPRRQRYMVTAGFAGCIIIGTLAGAVLKMNQEVKAEKQKMREATVDERVAFLEERREYLVGQKAELDKKIGGLHERMKARESGLSGR